MEIKIAPRPPLTHCWEWNLWKSQDQFIKGKVEADLGSSDKVKCFFYTDFPRAAIFGEFGFFNGKNKNRLTINVFLL